MNLDVMLAKRKMRLGELAERVGISIQNLSVLKRGRARAVRFSTLAAICKELDCQPGDVLEFRPDEVTALRVDEERISGGEGDEASSDSAEG
ncbi:MAG: helix-turn-helix domain-containing protein [Lacipirellulaceae bacterium]